MIDDGETDWKVVAIDVTDPWAASMHDIEDVEAIVPGCCHAIREWFRLYKVPDGKPENNLASEIPRSAQDSMKVVEENHGRWKALCGRDGTSMYSLEGAEDFWLKSPECRGY